VIDAGVEMESHYTADITRTLPSNGKFNEAQRKIDMLVYEAQRAGFAAIKPGAKFADINRASQEVLAKGLEEMGVLPISAEESMQPDSGLHRRWTVHGVSHMLGMDVHDCAQARKDQYLEGTSEAGMVLTVEPGLYIHPDDLPFPAEYRGIGVRFEDLVTETALLSAFKLVMYVHGALASSSSLLALYSNLREVTNALSNADELALLFLPKELLFQ
jgi:Xaa-Pro aminopeptidase